MLVLMRHSSVCLFICLLPLFRPGCTSHIVPLMMLSSLLSATIIEVIRVVAARLGRAPRRVVGQKRLHRCPNGIESFPLLIPKNALLSPRRGLAREARIDRLSVSLNSRHFSGVTL